jgi:hypothetical protein
MAAAVKRINKRMGMVTQLATAKFLLTGSLVFRENFHVALGARFELVPRSRVGPANDTMDGVSEQAEQTASGVVDASGDDTN